MAYRFSRPPPDVHVPAHQRNKWYRFDVAFTESACNHITCTSAKRDEMCKPEEGASYYRIGDNAFGLQCQPACFHLRDSASWSPNTPHWLRMTWNPITQECVFVPPIATWMEHPTYRAKEPTERLSDLPIGFDKGTPERWNETSLAYWFNKYYCDVYNLSFDSDDKYCYNTFGRSIGNLLIGENVINLTFLGVNLVKSKGASTLPPYRPSYPVPASVPHNMTVDGWLNDVDASFELPSVDFVFADGQDEHTFRGTRRMFTAIEEREKFRSQVDTVLQSGDGTVRDERPIDDASDIWGTIGLAVADIAGAIAADAAIEIALDATKKALNNFAKNAVPHMARVASTFVERGLSRVALRSAVKAFAAKYIALQVVKIASRFAVAFAKMAAAAATVVGVVLVVIQIFDFILSFFDIGGFKHYISDRNFLTGVMKRSESAYKDALSVVRLAIDVEMLYGQLLSREDTEKATLDNFKYCLEYFNDIDVNSDGNVIDKTPISFDDLIITEQRIDYVLTALSVKSVDDFDKFERTHSARLDAETFFTRVYWIAACVVAVLVATGIGSAWAAVGAMLVYSVAQGRALVSAAVDSARRAELLSVNK